MDFSLKAADAGLYSLDLYMQSQQDPSGLTLPLVMEESKAEGSMSKLKAGDTAVAVTEQAVQILGGYGYIEEFPVEKWYRDSKIYKIFEGTSEIQRMAIARALPAG